VLFGGPGLSASSGDSCSVVRWGGLRLVGEFLIWAAWCGSEIILVCSVRLLFGVVSGPAPSCDSGVLVLGDSGVLLGGSKVLPRGAWRVLGRCGSGLIFPCGVDVVSSGLVRFWTWSLLVWWARVVLVLIRRVFD
jgi:hypothetical protein